ncbi:TauD-domain-containing protein [Trametopsis cervina]|nr:TauD-domain-containing protein [Trametopsis cervina]
MSTTTTTETVTAPAELSWPVTGVEPYKYEHLVPVFPKDEHYPPLTPFEHEDPGHRALKHPDPRSFLANAKVTQLTPPIGEEIRGINLATLDNDAKDQLALEVAKRKVLVIRDQQDFIDRAPEFYLEWGRYFGRLHIHPTSGHPEGFPHLHLVYRDEKSSFNYETSDRTIATTWHSDVSYERQPPGLTALFLVSSPEVGGDTLFASQVSTLKRLSPDFVAVLKTLKAEHSAHEQADYSRSGKRGGVVRRDPVVHVHPVVRKHPVTGEEALYVNRQFTRRIVGFKKEESDAILNFLYDHIDRSIDSQVRAKWEPYTVVLWDNRVTVHSAILDFIENKGLRHGIRVTPQAERPIPANPNLQVD